MTGLDLASEVMRGNVGACEELWRDYEGTSAAGICGVLRPKRCLEVCIGVAKIAVHDQDCAVEAR
jgi:hypothetical protein